MIMTAKLESMKGWAARLVMTLLLIVTATTTTWAEDFVTDVMLIGGNSSKANQLKSSLENDGWTVINKNLNDGCPDGDYIYLAYKTESNTDGFNYGYITDFVIRADPGTVDESITYSEHTYSLVPIQGGSTFLSSRGNLNSGAGGESIHLYYTRDNFADHRAVTGITINSSSSNAVSWYNLNEGTEGSSIYMHITTATAVTLLSGAGTGPDPYLIGSTNDWETFTMIVQNGHGDGKYFKLTADISVTTMAGTSEKPFKGTFDGNGKTLTVDISSSEQGAAPFHYVTAATIKNLTVGGTVAATAYHAAGLAGICSGTLIVTGCAVATNISASGYAGGIVGHSGSNTVNIRNSYYSGTISGFTNYAGGLIGWGDAQTLNMSNCLFRGTFTPAGGGLYHPIACTNHSSTATATVTDAYYLNTITPTAVDDKTIPGAEGTPVSETYIFMEWHTPIEAADGNTYYIPPVAQDVTIGEGTSTSQYLPFQLRHFYSYVQQIYTADEIDMAGTITAIAFRFTQAFSISGVQVYLKHTDKNRFEERDNAVPISAADKVFEGTYSATDAGWAVITLDTPFEYDGNSNLLVCCFNTTIGPDSDLFGSYYHYADNMTNEKGFPEEPPIVEKFVDYVGYDMNKRNNIQLSIIPSTNRIPKPVNLSVSSFTDQEATLTWAAPETDDIITGYTYQYKQANQMYWSEPVTVGANTTSATITGLSAFTGYKFRVKALSGEKEGLYEDISFTTAISLPYECGFENGMDGWSMVDCYLHAENGLDLPGYITGINTREKRSGERSFMFYVADYAPQYLISPRMHNVAPLVVSFYYKDSRPNLKLEETFQVGYSTTTNDPSAFTWGDEIVATNIPWTLYEHIFPAGTRYVAVRYNSTSLMGLHLDDFSFSEYSTYATPTGLAASELTYQGAWLSWTAPTDASFEGYAYQYKKVSDDKWSDEKTWPKNSTAIGLNNLTANTEYDFRIKALYADGNTSSYVSTRFLTDGFVDSLPYMESFEDGMGGWRIVDGIGSTGIYSWDTDYAHTGSQSFHFYSSDNQEPYQYLMSPQFDGEKSMKVSFYYKTVINNPATFQVGYSTTSKDPSAFTWEKQTISDGEWQEYVTFFPAGTKYVAVKWIYGRWLFVDDFSFTESIVPVIPQQLTATNLTNTTADISWTGNTETYQVRYKKVPLFFDDFEQGFNYMKWKTVNNGGTSNTDWNAAMVQGNKRVLSHSGSYVAIGRSYDPDTDKGYAVDNWLITPQVTLDGTLKFWVADDGQNHEHYEVWVSTTTDDISAFTKVAEPGPPSDLLTWTEKSVDLSSYQGQKGYVAIRLNSQDKNLLLIDDFGIYLNDDDYKWNTVTTTDESVRLTGLDALSDYECQVRGTIGTYATEWSDRLTFTTTTVPGDANGDGDVTITDAVAVVNVILGQSAATFNRAAADINQDNAITITDAVGIVNIILGK